MSSTVTVRYFAAARAAAGVETETLPLASACTLEEFRALIVAAHPEPPAGEPPLSTVVPQCSFLVGGVTLLDGAVIEPGATVDVLPPFSGG